MDLPFPMDVGDWTWETVESLSDQPEGQYIEYKQSLFDGDNNQISGKWREQLEREITAFANANGGIIVFGVNDKREPSPFQPPEHEISRSVTQAIQNTNPVPEVHVSDPIGIPESDTDRVVVVVRVEECIRKPVLTSDSAIYRRVNESKEPMSREQIESLFLEHDRRQQGIRQLEMEINQLYEVLHGTGRKINIHGETPPDFHLVNYEALKEVMRQNTHLYSSEDTATAADRVFAEIRRLEDMEVYVGRVHAGTVDIHHPSLEKFNRDQRKEFKERVERLEWNLGQLAEAADLDVKIEND